MSKNKSLLLSLVAIVGITFGAIWAFKNGAMSLEASAPSVFSKQMNGECQRPVE